MKTTCFFTLALAAWLICSSRASAQPQIYSFVTIAGDSSAGSSEGTNTDARFYGPTAIAVDALGDLFVADAGNFTIRKLTQIGTNWVSSTIAGRAGYQGTADGTGSNARFYTPLGIAVDASGSVYVADSYNPTIRKLTPVGTNWIVNTIAGSPGSPGPPSLGVDGTNSGIRFSWPTSVAVDSAGGLYIADYHKLRKLSQIGTNWVSSTIAFTNYGFGQLLEVAFDNTGDLYMTGAYFIGNDGFYGVIARLTQAGTNWIGENLPRPPDGNYGFFQIGVREDGQVFITKQNHTIWQCVRTGTDWVWAKVAGQGWTPGSTDGINDDALFNVPFGAAVDAGGNLYVADSGNNTIRKVTPLGSDWLTSTIAGVAPNTDAADGTNRAALFSTPTAVAVGNDGKVYVADYGAHAIRKTERIGNDWVTTTIAGTLGSPGSADGANADAQFNNPGSLAMAVPNILYVADTGNNTIRKLERIGADWVTTTIAGVAGNANRQDGTNSDIGFDGPNAIAMDVAGNLYVAESAYDAIRMLTPVGTNWVSSTIADEAGPVVAPYPGALSVGTDGALYIANFGWGTIDELSPFGTNWVFSTIAGGAPDYSRIDPAGIALDSDGNLHIADNAGSTIRKLTRVGTNWVSSTTAGVAGSPGSTDGINGDARFSAPFGIALDSAGNLYVSDTGNNTLRLGTRLPPPVIRSIVQASGSITFTWSAVVGLTYQPQYNSDLTSTNWMNLRSSITATNEIMSASDVFGPDRQRFYRIALLP